MTGSVQGIRRRRTVAGRRATPHLPPDRDVYGQTLNKLTDRERQVVDFRFGLSDGYSRTIEEVARLFNTTRESIRTIEAKCMREMREDSRLREI